MKIQSITRSRISMNSNQLLFIVEGLMVGTITPILRMIWRKVSGTWRCLLSSRPNLLRRPSQLTRKKNLRKKRKRPMRKIHLKLKERFLKNWLRWRLESCLRRKERSITSLNSSLLKYARSRTTKVLRRIKINTSIWILISVTSLYHTQRRDL